MKKNIWLWVSLMFTITIGLLSAILTAVITTHYKIHLDYKLIIGLATFLITMLVVDRRIYSLFVRP